MTVMLAIVFLAAACVLAATGYSDLKARRIPNALPATLMALGAAKWVVVSRLPEIGWAFVAAGIVLLTTAVMFWRGWMGGGDVKLLTAATFLVGGRDAVQLIYLTALLGGLVAVIVLIHGFVARRLAKMAAAGEGAPGLAKATVPYGIAIASATAWILLEQWNSR